MSEAISKSQMIILNNELKKAINQQQLMENFKNFEKRKRKKPEKHFQLEKNYGEFFINQDQITDEFIERFVLGGIGVDEKVSSFFRIDNKN